MDSYDVIANAVIDYWEINYPQDVIAFFQQKYSWDDVWEKCEELVECHRSDDYENMTFLTDFCEGQTEVKDVVIVPLRDVTAFYYKGKIAITEITPITNADRIRSMTDEELAEKLGSFRCPQKWCFPDDGKNCKSCWLEWLRQEVTDEHP